MRWKADLPKMPRLPKVPLEPGDLAADALGPPPAPRAYREKNPLGSQPAEYQAPTMLVEHRGLALLFIVAAIGFALYCWRTSHRTAAREAASPAAHGAAQTSVAPQTSAAAQTPVPSTAQSPIYVEALPDKDR